jgi:hypothetical protein
MVLRRKVCSKCAMADVVARLRKMPWGDRRILISAAVLLPSSRILLRDVGLRRLYGAMLQLLPPARDVTDAPGGTERARLDDIARLVDAASRHTVASTCLHRSLTLWWLLRRRRFPARLQFGVRKHDGRFEAHAWVEYAGAVISDAETATGQYTAVPLVPLKNDA